MIFFYARILSSKTKANYQ